MQWSDDDSTRPCQRYPSPPYPEEVVVMQPVKWSRWERWVAWLRERLGVRA